MLEVFVKIFCGIILAIIGMYIIKEITGLKSDKNKLSQILLILTLACCSVVLHQIEYTGLSTIVIFFLNIIIYKLIFKFVN